MKEQTKFKFEKRPYKNEHTEATKELLKKMAMMAEMSKDANPEDMQLTEANIPKWRQLIDGWQEGILEKEKVMVETYKALVDVTEEKIKMNDGAEIALFIQRPKTLTSQSAPAYFYAHGGGAVFLTAGQHVPLLNYVAVVHNCVVFNIDYRLGPEVKAPRGQQDFVDAVNHVLASPTKYGINPTKTCMSGVSGGGWIVAGAANLMAKSNQIGKIRAIMIQTGMLSNSTQSIPKEQLQTYETDYGMGGSTPDVMTATYKLHATDFENQQNDDQLFPGRTSDNILKMWPPTVVFTSEFDFLRRDNELFAARLKSVGKLAEISEIPGVTHGHHGENFDSRETKQFYEEEKMAFKCLVDY